MDPQSNLLHLAMESRGRRDLRGHGLDLRSCHGRRRQHADGRRRRQELGRFQHAGDERGDERSYSGSARHAGEYGAPRDLGDPSSRADARWVQRNLGERPNKFHLPVAACRANS